MNSVSVDWLFTLSCHRGTSAIADWSSVQRWVLTTILGRHPMHGCLGCLKNSGASEYVHCLSTWAVFLRLIPCPWTPLCSFWAQQYCYSIGTLLCVPMSGMPPTTESQRDFWGYVLRFSFSKRTLSPTLVCHLTKNSCLLFVIFYSFFGRKKNLAYIQLSLHDIILKFL